MLKVLKLVRTYSIKIKMNELVTPYRNIGEKSQICSVSVFKIRFGNIIDQLANELRRMDQYEILKFGDFVRNYDVKRDYTKPKK